MDALELAFLAMTLALSIAIGVQHFYDRFAENGFYRRSTRQATEGVERLTRAVQMLPTAIVPPALPGLETLQDALGRVQGEISALPSRIGPEIGRAIAELAMKAGAVLPPSETSAPVNLPQIAGGVESGIVRREKSELARSKELNVAIGESILGKYGSLLKTFAAPVYDFLAANPDMALSALQSKPVQDIIRWASQQAAEHPELASKLESAAQIAPIVKRAVDWWELA